MAIIFKMSEQVEKLICIRFCIKFELSSMEIIWVIQKAFGDDVTSATQIKMWHKYFNDVWGFVESDPHPGRPATSRIPENVEHVQAEINKDWQPRRLGPPTARIWHPVTSGLWKRKTFQTISEIQGNTMRQLMVTQQRILQSVLNSGRDAGRNGWSPKVPILKGTEASLSNVQCFLYLISSLIFFVVHGWILSGQTSF